MNNPMPFMINPSQMYPYYMPNNQYSYDPKITELEQKINSLEERIEKLEEKLTPPTTANNSNNNYHYQSSLYMM